MKSFAAWFLIFGGDFWCFFFFYGKDKKSVLAKPDGYSLSVWTMRTSRIKLEANAYFVLNGGFLLWGGKRTGKNNLFRRQSTELSPLLLPKPQGLRERSYFLNSFFFLSFRILKLKNTLG